MGTFESEKLKQVIALAGILLLGFFILFALSGFIPAFLGSIIFFIICSPLMNYLSVTKKVNKGLAVTLVLIFSFLLILAPVFSLTNLLISKLTEMLADNSMVFFTIHDANKYIDNLIGINVMTPENIVKVQEKVTELIPNLLNQTITVVADIAIMYFVLFYLLYTDMHLKEKLVSVFPYSKENTELFVKELTSQTYSNVIGAPLLALVQACFAVLGFYIFGLQEPVFWGVMCGFLSFIPFVGTALVWIPAAFILLSVADSWQGVGLLIYGGVVITNVDNIFRFVIQKKIANVHPMVTVFGVIIGLNWFGLPGLIFGPILISYLLIMIRIYRLEYGSETILETKNTNNSSLEN